jgi:hypothetical protein
VSDTLTAGDTENGSASPARSDAVTASILSSLLDRTAAVERGLTVLTGEVIRLCNSLAAMHACQRRDLHYAADVDAATTSAAFITTEMPTATALPDAPATLRHAAGLVSVPGMAVEFGVATGTSLGVLVECLPGRPVVGFDVFTGLPEDWRTGFVTGMFAQTPPVVPGATIVQGLFADTLPGFLADNPGPIAFAHVDCDLYSSTVTVLEHIGPRLRSGSIVIFDEYLNYPGWQEHEHKAWREFAESSGIGFSYEAYTSNHEQLVVRITTPVS